jgi:hypothetical protein
MYVPAAGFAEAIPFHISGQLLDQLCNYGHFKKEQKKERSIFT